MVLIALILFNKICKYKKIKVWSLNYHNKYYQILIEALSQVIIKNMDLKLVEYQKEFSMVHFTKLSKWKSKIISAIKITKVEFCKQRYLRNDENIKNRKFEYKQNTGRNISN